MNTNDLSNVDAEIDPELQRTLEAIFLKAVPDVSPEARKDAVTEIIGTLPFYAKAEPSKRKEILRILTRDIRNRIDGGTVKKPSIQ